MKIIISHDVDHLTALEHIFKDSVLLKNILRQNLELLVSSISLKEYFLRYKDLFQNKLQNISELVDFDLKNKIPSTFFFGMDNGLGLNYSLKEATKWIKFVENKGFSTGVHGINYKDYNLMLNEFKTFQSITSQDKFGIRMHYLRHDQYTQEKLSKIGYAFDATIIKKGSVYIKNGMPCFPLHIMDSYEIYKGDKFVNSTFDEIMKNTKKEIDIMLNKKVDYLSINFHDVYFSDSYKVFYDWYCTLVNYLRRLDIEFINFNDAILELNVKKQNFKY